MPGSDSETRNRVGRLERLLSTHGPDDPVTDPRPEFAREVAAENARLSRTLRTALEIGTAVESDTDLPRILELIVERARALVDADGLLIWLRHGDQLRIAAVAGHADVPRDAAIPLGGSTAGMALKARRSLRVEDAQQCHQPERVRHVAGEQLPARPPRAPRPRSRRARGFRSPRRDGELRRRQRAGPEGVRRKRCDRGGDRAPGRRAAAARLDAAAESERGRWARELHDETLQGLASLKLALAGALKADPKRARTMLGSAVTRLDHDIDALLAIIVDLRPAALDELGLEPALRTLVAEVTEAAGLDARVAIELGGTRSRRTSRRSPIASRRKR